jgi:hypothetical protein
LPADDPRPPRFRPQRFARSRRVAPPRALRACFIALPCPGFSLQGFSPAAQPYRLVGGPSPRAVGAVACRLPGASERRVDLRVLLRAVVRSVRRGFYARSALVSPPAFSTPSGIGPMTLAVPSHPLRSRPSRRGTACPPRRRSSAYRSILVLWPLSPEARPVRASWPASRLPFPRGPSVSSGPLRPPTGISISSRRATRAATATSWIVTSGLSSRMSLSTTGM